jgi:hypothetical protein
VAGLGWISLDVGLADLLQYPLALRRAEEEQRGGEL